MAGGNKVAVKVEAFDALNRSFTVADGTQVSKGTLMTLSDPRTAAKCTSISVGVGGGTPAAGIANSDKVANDGATNLGLWTKGVFDIYASGAINAGQKVCFLADGYVGAVSTTTTTAASMGIVGKALETAGDGEQIEISLELA